MIWITQNALAHRNPSSLPSEEVLTFYRERLLEIDLQTFEYLCM
jgi:hypothetical protein